MKNSEGLGDQRLGAVRGEPCARRTGSRSPSWNLTNRRCPETGCIDPSPCRTATRFQGGKYAIKSVLICNTAKRKEARKQCGLQSRTQQWTYRSLSERNIVVAEIVRRRLRRALCLLRARGAALGTFAAAIAAVATTATALSRAATEHLHLVGNDVGEELLDTVLAGELVVADRTFDVDLASLLEVFTGDLAELAEQLDPM